MQHTKRYLLVPEEIYQSLASPPPSDGTPIGLVRNRIKQIKNDDGINEAERAIKYEQELKRFNKLTRDEDERPVGVKLENLSDVVDAMPKSVNVRRPIVVATRRHLKVGRARKENVEQLEDDDDDHHDDHDLETPKPSSSNKRQPTQTEILKLIYKNAQSLGVSEEGQVLRAAIIMDLKKLRLLEFLYKDLSSPVAFTSVEPLLREARKTQPKINRTDVQNYLATQRTYTLHRQAKRRYRRLPTLAPGLHTEWQADLAIFDRLAKQNRGYKYLLVCIDTLSRQVFVQPVRTKTSANMIIAFGRIFKRSKYIPWKVLTDQGKEFTARAVQQFFRTNDVEHFCMLTSPQFHAGMAERANRSIKERLYRYFTERNTYKWIGVVQDIVRAINHSPNSTIGMCPADLNFKNAEALRQKLHNAAENVVRRQPRYRVGDRVRIEKYKHVFKKGYLPRFTNELFTVAEDKFFPSAFTAQVAIQFGMGGTVEQQFVQIEWQTGNTVRIEVPPSNVTNPHELSKNLYRLLGEGSDPLAKKVRSTQNSFMLTINKARRWAREEYIKRKTKEKRGVREEELLLQAMLADTGTLVELNSVDHGLLAREKRAETSNIALRIPADDDDSYQKKLDEYFSKLSDKNLSILDELGMTKLNAEIKNLTEEERAIIEATKEMGTEAWIQAYREIRLVCQFNYDVHRNRFVLNTDPRYVKKVKVSPQLAYILGFNNTEFMQAENEARFVPDMSGGVSSFHVYTPDLIEPMMIGDVTAPVLRIVTIRGNPDQSANSSACGRHVIFFLYCRCVGMTFEKIVRFLHFGKQQPDTLRKFQLKMHVDFDPLQVDWSAFSSECVQFGGYNIYRGLPYQRGAGVGAVFRSLMRYLLPIGKQIGSAIGRQGMKSGNRVLTNVLEGKDLKESLVSESKVLPLATITQESPYLFRLYSDNLWTDLSRIYLYLELSIEKPGANDKWIAIDDADTSVSAIQGIGQTFVQQLKVTVGNTEVYDSGNLYPFKAYITNELSFPINAKKNFLGSTGYYHTVNQDDSTDEGFKERCKIFKGGKNAQFLSRLDFDLGNQELYLLNNLDLLFTIYKAKDVFLLQTLKANDATKYRLTVHDVKIYAKMVEVQPSLNMSLYKTLEKQPATYAVRKTEIKSSFISVGRYEFEYNVFSATIPRRVTIALVGNSAFHGDYKLSPFMFEPFDLREISIHAGGVVYPAVPYKLNFSKDHFVSAFVDMYEALGMANSERSFDISMAQFKKGWSFFVIPLTSTLDDSCGFELLRSGTTNVRPAQYSSSSAQMTIKERLYRYFTERNTYKWIGVVQDIVRAINHSPNSTIGMCPADLNFKNAEALRQKLHNAAENVVRRQPRYRVGDRVRIEKYKHVFKKGYLPRFTNELFTVAEDKFFPSAFTAQVAIQFGMGGTVEQQFVQIEWQTGNTVRIEVPPSNVTNPHELSKNLYRLLGEGSDPLAKKVRSTQNSFMLTINKARRWAREEYIKRKTKEKRGVREEELLLQAMLADTGTLVELNSVDHGLLAREKRAETSNIALRIPADDDDSYQKKLDEYFSKLSDKNLSILDELGMTKLNAEIKNLTEEERAILEATKEMGTEAWIQAYREIRLVCQFNYDVHRNRFVLNTDPRYVKKVKVSPQLAYILGFNNTEFMQAENEARFVPDMSGGVSSFHVYTPDLIEPMMIGDVTAPVLRIVTIRGNPDQVFALWKAATGHALDWSAFSSECVQFGGYNIYRGLPYQRGAGVGAVFRSLMRYLLPIGKQIGSAIGRQGMKSGNRVLTNVLEGKDLKESLVSESKVLPLATITQESPYLFRLYSDNLWTDLLRIYLYLELSIEKPGANDKWIAIDDADTSVSAIQGIGQTFVQQLKVTVGNTEVYDSGNLYPFKAYITNELSFPINAKKNFLGSTGYYHTVNQDDSTDEGFKERCKIFKGGKNAQFLSRLDFDLGNQELYLLNNLDLLFTIYKAKDVFLLQTLKANDATKYRLTVHDVKIYAKMVEVQPSLNMSLYKTLEKQPATYAVRKLKSSRHSSVLVDTNLSTMSLAQLFLDA
ncbi:hypothetical protein niasHS_009763 [Heterodera schachtii]|uniref:Integrase catalytic domain-containing protein n=1 Tax=Heterodera schachtii TaxID=97005 RepID=A0ABD2J2C3_HETSC